MTDVTEPGTEAPKKRRARKPKASEAPKPGLYMLKLKTEEDIAAFAEVARAYIKNALARAYAEGWKLKRLKRELAARQAWLRVRPIDWPMAVQDVAGMPIEELVDPRQVVLFQEALPVDPSWVEEARRLRHPYGDADDHAVASDEETHGRATEGDDGFLQVEIVEGPMNMDERQLRDYLTEIGCNEEGEP